MNSIELYRGLKGRWISVSSPSPFIFAKLPLSEGEVLKKLEKGREGANRIHGWLNAVAGRLKWHVEETPKGRRRFLRRELDREIPVAFGISIIGDNAMSFLELFRFVGAGVIASPVCLGPRGAVRMKSWHDWMGM